YEFIAVFDSVDGLDVGSDVRISGIKVGTVIEQSLDIETFEAVVHFKINSGLKLSTDSSATIASEGLLGGNYLSISTGAMDEFLEPGGTIEFTQGSVNLMDLIGQAIYSVSDDEKTYK
ncbi:MAG: outer membrane lipid asymmetry maintenance protein MlaD, partial [Sphingomonadales bacterium]